MGAHEATETENDKINNTIKRHSSPLVSSRRIAVILSC